jgi:hypothetical protein
MPHTNADTNPMDSQLWTDLHARIVRASTTGECDPESLIAILSSLLTITMAGALYTWRLPPHEITTALDGHNARFTDAVWATWHAAADAEIERD